jgi:hypothetical protein
VAERMPWHNGEEVDWGYVGRGWWHAGEGEDSKADSVALQTSHARSKHSTARGTVARFHVWDHVLLALV